MLHLTPSDRASIDELCALPVLVETGALDLDTGKGVIGACEVCDEGQDEAASWPIWLRKGLWIGVYGSLCAIAIWTHLRSPDGQEDRKSVV